MAFVKIKGVYKFTAPTFETYIGRSMNILQRWSYHKTVPQNSILCESFMKHGFDKHRAQIIMVCSPEADDDYIGCLEAFFEEQELYSGNTLLNNRECGPGQGAGRSYKTKQNAKSSRR